MSDELDQLRSSAHRVAVELALHAETVLTNPSVDLDQLRQLLGQRIDAYIGSDGDRAASLVSALLQALVDAIAAGRLPTGPTGWLQARDVALSG